MYGKSDRTIDFTADLKLALYHACSDEQYKDVVDMNKEKPPTKEQLININHDYSSF